MANDSSLKILLITEGSGGHLIPALQVATLLATRGARIKVWYAKRSQTASLAEALTHDAAAAAIDVDPIPVRSSSSLMERLWACGQLWQKAQRCFDTFAPDVVVGFGGWVSAPVVLAARLRRTARPVASRRRIGCLLHEQNVVMGRANQWLARWVDRVALSFRDTQAQLDGTPAVITGLPVRRAIGCWSRAQAAEQFGVSPAQPTLLVLGGSQGSRALNRLMPQVAERLAEEERRRWQILHLTGPADTAAVRETYAAHHIRAWVAPLLVEMEAAYALADLVLARAGASTIAELARCGTPAVLIPYPHAGGHQRANARLVETAGGGVLIEEADATPESVLASIRRILTDERLRHMMGEQMRGLSCADAAERLTEAIEALARHPGRPAGS